MTTLRQLLANRANARKSTGPNSSRGRAFSRSNARRHGLAALLHENLEEDEEVERLARAIAGAGTEPEVLALARRVAEAEITVRRIFRGRMNAELGPINSHRGPEAKVELSAFDRYERRALSRRKFAIRDFDELMRSHQTSD